MKTTKFLNVLFGAAALFLTAGCADLNRGYNDPYYGGGYGDPYSPYSHDSYETRREHERLERERERLHREQRELDRERERRDNDRHDRDRHDSRPPPPPVREHCPSGYSPSENKCSAAERKHGCKDMRLPGGLGCVHR